MRFGIFLLLVFTLEGAAPRKQNVAQAAGDVVCVDVPRVAARKVRKLELNEAMRKELAGVLFGVSLNERLELNFDMESPTEDGATQLEKMVGLLASAEQMKAERSDVVVIDLPRASTVSRNGKVVRTTVSLTDQQLEKLLEARYGRKLVSEAKARLVFVHGMLGGTKSYPWAENLTIDLGR